ncbi:MAG: hypothetical protein STHCBS139747_000313 [Sporothrix thermara]
MEGDDAARPSVFYFERPAVSPIYLPEANASSEHEKVITDHLLDYAEMDLGWIKANGPSVFDDKDPYVSDDDGSPSEVRISPAIFRALAAGCTLDDVLCRKAELARECQEVKDHYREQCRLERQAGRRAARHARQAHRKLRQRQRIVRGISENLRSLQIAVAETEARLAQGRELQTMLSRRLRDGEARLTRMCRDHGVANVAALLEVLEARMARLGANEEE